jgi:hypothetical protein
MATCDSEVKLSKSKINYFSWREKMCQGKVGSGEILKPWSISSNTQYVTPSLKSFDDLQEWNWVERLGCDTWKRKCTTFRALDERDLEKSSKQTQLNHVYWLLRVSNCVDSLIAPSGLLLGTSLSHPLAIPSFIFMSGVAEKLS